LWRDRGGGLTRRYPALVKAQATQGPFPERKPDRLVGAVDTDSEDEVWFPGPPVEEAADVRSILDGKLVPGGEEDIY
jgi:hypothetical protein